MNFYKILFFITIVISLNVLAEDDWQKTLEKEGIEVYKKDSKNSDIQSLKARGIVRAPIDKIITILRDVDNSTKWVPNLLDRKYIKNVSDTEAILYDVTDMPWPITDRDTVVHHTLVLSEDKKSVILNFLSASNDLKTKDSSKVRAEILTGYIRFTPIGDHTEVEMFILVDPKGNIPAWAVNIVQVSMPYDFIKALDKFAIKSTLPTPQGIKNLLDLIQQPVSAEILELKAASR